MTTTPLPATNCGAKLEKLWRDEDIAMADPRLLKIDTCQLAVGHNGYHTARTEDERAAVHAAVDAAAAKRVAARKVQQQLVVRAARLAARKP